MNATVRSMTLKELLERHGILAASELSRRTDLSRAQAYNLWRGKAGVGRETMRLLHDRLGIPYDELMEVDVVGRPPKRTGGEGGPAHE
jgi:transcriptional regulator with XRE-family HTH domain